MGKNWSTKGLEGLLDVINDRINPWVASAIDRSETTYEAKRVLLKALYKEYQEREKQTWHWKEWYQDLIVDVLSGKREKE